MNLIPKSSVPNHAEKASAGGAFMAKQNMSDEADLSSGRAR